MKTGLYKISVLIILFLVYSENVFSQDSTRTKLNTIKLKAGFAIYAEDTVIVAQNDTIIKLPIWIDFYIENVRRKNRDDFYIKLQEEAYKHRWSQELHNIIIVPPSKNVNGDTLQTRKSEVPFLKYKNLVIRDIRLKRLDVFGPTIYQPEAATKTWIGKTANGLHVKTNSYVIQNHLLFKRGDAIDPYILADNERLLRELPYIHDALIKVTNISPSGDSADIEVITKDTWSVGFDVETPLKAFTINIWDINLLGSGQESNNKFFNNPGKLPYRGLDGYYLVRNIGGSFIDLSVGYSAFGPQGYSLNLKRDFFTQRTKYAGGLSFEKRNTYAKIPGTEENTYFPIDYINKSLWIGRAFKIANPGLSSTSYSNFIVSAGIFSNNFSVRPEVTPKTKYEFHNKTYYLISYGLLNQGYYRSNLVYNFGRTEDIPYGMLLKITNGIENNEFFHRLYGSVLLSKGNYLGNFGYGFANISLGGFLRNKRVEQGMIKLSTNFFTNLLVIDALKFRHFLSINFVKGYHRFNDEFLNINNIYGIRGYENDSAKGTQKLSINYESVCFTPLYVMGFRFALFAFADLSYVGKTTKSVFKNPLYSGFGIGVRIRNEKLVFKTLQLRFAFYPWMPKSAKGEYITIAGESKFELPELTIDAPDITKFQ